MTINDQRSITMFRAYNQITGDSKTIMDILKKTIPSLDGLELEQVSGRLHHLSVLLNGLYGILGYDSPDEAFADVVDYEIVDQLKWLQVLRNQIGRKCYNLGYKEQNMLYISGIPALNIPCPTLDTSGDWHRSGLNWSKVPLWDSDLSFWGDWGIQSDIYIRELDGYFNVADT